MEVIGGIASVTQLCEYIVQGISAARATFKEFEELPKAIADRTIYLDSLSSIVQSISANKSMQTKDIIPLLKIIQQHIGSLNEVLATNLQRVQKTAIKSFAHLFRKRESDRKEIEQALVDLEHDKSNLSLFMLNRFGESVAQIANMSNVKMLADLEERKPADSRPTEQSGQRLGSSEDAPAKTALVVSAADKRKWKGMKVKGQEASMIAGDRNADAETTRARAEAGDEREWEELEVEGDKAEGVFGDVNELPKDSAIISR